MRSQVFLQEYVRRVRTEAADSIFIQKSGCVSCHNNNLTAMSVAAARKGGVPFNEQTARKQLKTIATYLEGWRERVLQGSGIPGDSDTISSLADESTARVDFLTDMTSGYLPRQAIGRRWH